MLGLSLTACVRASFMVEAVPSVSAVMICLKPMRSAVRTKFLIKSSWKGEEELSQIRETVRSLEILRPSSFSEVQVKEGMP